MSPRPCLLLLIILFFALAPAHARAGGQLGGSLLYGVGQYRAEVDGQEVRKISSQYEQVLLYYQKSGMIGDKRLGQYSLLLGYEFNIFDPTISSYGVKDPGLDRIDTGKLLYKGEILLAPGGLPFRVHAYARDVHQSRFVAGNERPDLPIGLQRKSSQTDTTLLTPDIMTDIANGTHFEMGATLLVGIRNGSYLGSYRDVLSQLPRLLIDYKQLDVRDLSRDTNQEHYRARDLAFISLNKKDNWVHFRVHEYVNFLDRTQNFDSKQLMIGTVDQTLTRQWVNFTNWIRVSGDLSYTAEHFAAQQDEVQTYRTNLFAVATSQELKVTALPYTERIVEGPSVAQRTELPLYFNYEPNSDSYYRGNFRGTLSRDGYLDGTSSAANPDMDTRNFTFDLGSELFRKGDTVFKPRIGAGIIEQGADQSIYERIVVEFSNNRRKKSQPWTAGYSLNSQQTSNATTSKTSTAVEQSLYGNVEENLNRNIRVGLRAAVRYGTGQAENSLGMQSGKLKVGITQDGIEREDVDGFLMYDYRIFMEHAGKLFSNRLEFISQVLKTDLDNSTSSELLHVLRMDGRMHQKLTLTSSLVRGNEVAAQASGFGYLGEVVQIVESEVTSGWSSKADYSYSPDRQMILTLNGLAAGTARDSGNEVNWGGSEKLQYHFYKRNGQTRKIAEVSEELGVEQTGRKNLILDRDRAIFLRMAAALYPSRHLYAKFMSEYVVFAPSSSSQKKFIAETGMNYEKFMIALSYGRADKEEEGDLPTVMEERWDLKVKKTF